jgi:signal transduction histidine kinase
MTPLSPGSGTDFAPAERADVTVIQQQAANLEKLRLLDPLLNALPDAVIILNPQRQIIYANHEFAAFTGQTALALLGQRSGEALGCIHAFAKPGGCGTTEHCSVCGATNAILTAQKGRRDVQECRILTHNRPEANALDLRVTATPFYFGPEGSEAFTMLAAVDISHEKRRQVLERIFFHDIANTAGAISGLVELLSLRGAPHGVESVEFVQMLGQASSQLIDEIAAQRQILAAERGELPVEPEPLYTTDFLLRVMALYRNHIVSTGRTLRLDPSSENVLFWSDAAILGRVVGNMVKNAMEACDPGDSVTLGCQRLFDYVRFWVHNPHPMPREVQLQIFKRSFSTKGVSRGLGTYSMKLLTEAYLQGRVSFTSNEAEGTIFMAMYPLEWVDVEEQLTAAADQAAGTVL